MRVALMIGTMAMAAAGAHGAELKKKPPYWASISAPKARMRTGPGKTYPASWLYVRPTLPVKVVGAFKEWRKVEDPGGTQGWMLANLLSETRTAYVPAGPVELRDHPAADGKVAWRAASGVVGRVSQCANGWCRLDVKGQAGFVEEGRLWGMEAGEALP